MSLREVEEATKKEVSNGYLMPAGKREDLEAFTSRAICARECVERQLRDADATILAIFPATPVRKAGANMVARPHCYRQF